MKTKNLGFTLVELIVVITILAILGTIGFITLQGYSASTRDTKRISDIGSLANKINIEQVRGVGLMDLIEIGSGHIASGSILGVLDENIITFGKINFDNLRETRSNFLDPSTKGDYPVSYAIGMGSGGLRYNFFELGTISEKELRNKIVGNYYTITQEDVPSLFLSGSIEYINNGEELIYEINNKQSNEIEEEEIPEEPEIITRNVYGDEDQESIEACNKWVEENVGELGGGAENWLWVPARHFTTDGYGIGMDDEYYKREIIHNNIKYICNGFAVAKYEMTYEEATEANRPNSSNNSYVYNPEYSVISRADRYAIASLSQLQAIEGCNNIGGENIGGISGLKFHLITNNEWMTIARNIELQANNWSTNQIGSGFISNGLSTSYFGCNSYPKNIYPGLEKTYNAKTGAGGVPECDEKRQLALSNGEIIWDLAGNVREYVNKGNNPITNINYNSNTIRPSNACGDGIPTPYSYSGNDGSLECNYQNGYTYDNIGPATPNLNANNGIGRIVSANVENMVLFRGGSSANGLQTGIYTLGLHVSDLTIGANDGFRCSL